MWDWRVGGLDQTMIEELRVDQLSIQHFYRTEAPLLYGPYALRDCWAEKVKRDLGRGKKSLTTDQCRRRLISAVATMLLRPLSTSADEVLVQENVYIFEVRRKAGGRIVDAAMWSARKTRRSVRSGWPCISSSSSVEDDAS